MEPTLEQQTEKKSKPTVEETPFEAFASICGVIVVLLFAQAFFFQNFSIPSSSMEKTLLVGDHLVVDRATLAPPTHWAPFIHYRDVQRGDIIVFYKPGEPDFFLVKRVIGIPGDHIHLINGIVYLNGVAQNEPQAAKPDPGNIYPFRDDFPAYPLPDTSDAPARWQLEFPTHIQNGDLVVPPGKYFAMGDNRLVSLDSRYWGFVPRENIVGRPLFVYWSFITPETQYEQAGMNNRIAWTTHMILHFFDQTRWSRTLKRVH